MYIMCGNRVMTKSWDNGCHEKNGFKSWKLIYNIFKKLVQKYI